MLKKLFLSCFVLVSSTTGWAQQLTSPADPDGDIVTELASSLSTLDVRRIPSGVLLDRTLPVVDPHVYNGGYYSPQSSYAAWQQHYGQFYQASLSTSGLTAPLALFNQVQARLNTGQAPLVMLQYAYQELVPNAAGQGLIRIDSLNERVYDGPNTAQTPYSTGQVFMAAVPATGLNPNGSGSLYIGPEFWVGNTPAPTGISIDLQDGLGFRYVAMGTTLSLPAGGGGDAAGRAASTLVCSRMIRIAVGGLYASIGVCRPSKVNEAPSLAIGINATRQWPGTSKRASAIAWVKWGQGNTSGKFHKPLVFVEGVDFEERNGDPKRGHDRKQNYFILHPPQGPISYIPLSDPQFEDGYRNGEAGWDEMVAFNDDYKSLEKLPELRQSLQASTGAGPADEGYDVIYLDFTDGADQIENNAMTLVDLLTYITNNKEGNQGTIVMGASMGGQVSRFALAWMEEQRLCNDVKLYVSLDSPHRGANVALGIQHMLNRLSGIHWIGRGSFLEQRGFLNRPASRQMLNYHFDPDATPARDAWQAWQNTPTSFPNYMRKVAITNGNGTGGTITGSYPGMEIMNANTGWQPILWGQNVVNALPGATSRGVNNVVFRYKRPFSSSWHFVQVPASTPAYDIAPGGMRQTTKSFNDQAPFWFETKLDFDTFIPSISALAITDAEVGPRYAANVNYNALGIISILRPDPAKYAFDAYFAPTENEPHIQITNGTASTQGTSYFSNNSAWVINELQQSAHRLPVVLTSQYNYGNLYRRYLPTLTVGNGGILLVNAIGIPVGGGPTGTTPTTPAESTFDLYAGSCAQVTLQQGAAFRIGNSSGTQNATVRFGGNALLDVQAGSQLTVHPGSVLRIQKGATWVVRGSASVQNNGQIIVETGAYVCIENMANIQGPKPVFQPGVTFAANPALNLGQLACTVDCANTVFSLVGNPIICNSSDYKVEGVPTGATVSWSIPTSAGSVLRLDPNVPNTNELRITNQKWYAVSTTLTATISGAVCGTGDVVLTKTIANDNSGAFSYYQEPCTFYNVSHPSQSGTASASQTTFVHQGCMVYVNLGNAQRTVTLASGGQPTVWGQAANNYYPNTLYFQLPYNSGGVPFTFTVDTKSDCGLQSLVFFTYANNARYAYTASPNPAEEEVTVTATATPTGNRSVQTKGTGKPHSYTVEVLDVTTGASKMLQRNANGNLQVKLNTSPLRPGVYLLRVIDDETTQTIRIHKQ